MYQHIQLVQAMVCLLEGAVKFSETGSEFARHACLHHLTLLFDVRTYIVTLPLICNIYIYISLLFIVWTGLVFIFVGKTISKAPVLSGQLLDLFKLYTSVQRHKGFVNVSNICTSNVYVCMYVCMYVTHLYACMYVITYTNTCNTKMHIHMCMYVRIRYDRTSVLA